MLPSLPKVDCLVTDPPFGVGLGVDKDMRRNGHGLGKERYASYEDTYGNYCQIVVPVISQCLMVITRGAVFVGPHVHEMPKPTAIGGIYCPAAVGMHCWGFNNLLLILFYGTDPSLQNGARHTVLRSSAIAEKNGHPAPKPIEWMKWLVGRTSREGETILDPFMGSGTTIRAAKDLGRKAIGIEIEERYCEIAANRLRQEVLAFA